MGLMLEQLAGRTAYNKDNPGDGTSKKSTVFFDPASILMYISILNYLMEKVKTLNLLGNI